MNRAWARFSNDSTMGGTPGRTEPVVQPGAGRLPVAVHGAARHAQDLRGLLERAAAEEAELDHAGLALVQGGEVPERLVEGEQVVIRPQRRELIIDLKAWRAPAALGCRAFA